MSVNIGSLQTLGGRICHDLAAPIGALSMGLEMLREQELTSAQQDVLQLVEQSLGSARTKLELFRYLVGFRHHDEKPAMLEIVPVLQKYWEKSRYRFQAQDVQDLKGFRARLALALILTAAECLPRGGEISLVYTPERLYVSVLGQGASLSEEAQAYFQTGTLTSQAKDVFAWYAQAVAQELSCRIDVVQDNPDHLAFFTSF